MPLRRLQGKCQAVDLAFSLPGPDGRDFEEGAEIMPTDEGYEIRSLTKAESQLAIDWAAAEGWNPGLNDASIFHGADPLGFLAGFREKRPVATIAAVRYGTGWGFIGFYIVKPDFRGRGLGLRIWNAAMDRLSGRNIGLDGVIAQQENYRKSGFTLAYRNVRYRGQKASLAKPHPSVVPLAQLEWDRVVEYDGELFFLPRPEFLRPWISQQGSLALGYVENGRIKGYGVIRQCRAGCKVGPLFANDAAVADALLGSLAEWAKGQEFFLDIPEPNTAAQSLVRTYRLSPVFETARMYTGEAPAIDLGRVFGVTSFELG